ncbi:hypothetical protein ABKU43_21795, partial [Enterobacter hormaechei]
DLRKRMDYTAVSKLIPYYFLGMLAMLLCMLVSVFILGVPYRGSLVLLFFITSLFLLSTIGNTMHNYSVLADDRSVLLGAPCPARPARACSRCYV